MTISVLVPTLLRNLTGGEKNISTQGNSVAEVIGNLEQQYPGLKRKLVNENQVHQFINIYINESDIRFANGLETPIKTGDKITILPAVAGG